MGWPSLPLVTRSKMLLPGVLSLASEEVLEGPVAKPLVNGAFFDMNSPVPGKEDGVSAPPLAATLGS